MASVESKNMHGRPVLRATFWLLPGLVLLAATALAQGEKVASPPAAGEPSPRTASSQDGLPPGAGVLPDSAAAGGESLGSGITVRRQGRLLVLTYSSQAAGGRRVSSVNSRHEPPGFVICKGQRPIATGKFEYG